MIRGTTQEFILRFENESLEIGAITDYCLAFGRSERKSTFDIFGHREDGYAEGESAEFIRFDRGIVRTVTNKSKRNVQFEVKLTEEESLKLKAGDAYLQLKFTVNGDVFSSSAKQFDVEDSLCAKEMNEHE